MAKTPPKRSAPTDIAILHGPTEDGEGARLLRFKEGEVYSGEIRPVREGQSIGHQELVRLKPLDPRFPVCEVEVLHSPAAENPPAARARRESSGPARVSTKGYRRNWSAIFGRKPATPLAAGKSRHHDDIDDIGDVRDKKDAASGRDKPAVSGAREKPAPASLSRNDAPSDLGRTIGRGKPRPFSIN